MASAAPAWRTRGRIRGRPHSGISLASPTSGRARDWRLRLATGLTMARGLALGVALALALALAGPLSAPAWADTPATQLAYRCDGDPLLAELYPGAVDAPGIANSSAGTLPGAFVVLHWRDLSLQLPRTNNAGAPSFTDGRWWWSVEDAEHPRFLLRQGRGDIRELSCRALLQAGG